MNGLNQDQIATMVNVEQAVQNYRRMRKATDHRRQTAMEVAAELRKVVDEMKQYLQVLYGPKLVDLAERLEE